MLDRRDLSQGADHHKRRNLQLGFVVEAPGIEPGRDGSPLRAPADLGQIVLELRVNERGWSGVRASA